MARVPPAGERPSMVYRLAETEQRRVPGVPSTAPAAPSIPNLKVLLVRAIELGRMRISQHFRNQAEARAFSTLDAEQILEEGEIISGPVFDSDFFSWKCEMFLKIEGKGWKLVVALDCASDYCESPLIHLITIHRIRNK